MRNRRVIINNTESYDIRKDLIQAIYKIMDKKQASECHITFVHENYVEVDLFDRTGACIAWATPVYSKKED